MCSFDSCQTRFEFLSQFRKVRNIYICVHVCVYIYIYIYIYACMNVCIMYVCMRACMCVCVIWVREGGTPHMHGRKAFHLQLVSEPTHSYQGGTVQITFMFIDFRVCDFAFAFKTQNAPCVSRFKRVLFSDRFQFAFYTQTRCSFDL